LGKACKPSVAAVSAVDVESARLWHRRFGHTGFSTLAKMQRGGTIAGLPPVAAFESLLNRKSREVCAPCAEAKHSKQPYHSSPNTASRAFEKLHVDISGPKQTSAGGNSYFTVVVCDLTGYKFGKAHPRKSDAASFHIEVIEHVRGVYRANVLVLRSDRDSVFFTFLQDYLRTRQPTIAFEPTSGYSPQESIVAERSIRTLSELVRAMLSDSGMDHQWWGDALRQACYISNITSSMGSACPWELVKGTKPCLDGLHIFGCVVWVYVPDELRVPKAIYPLRVYKVGTWDSIFPTLNRIVCSYLQCLGMESLSRGNHGMCSLMSLLLQQVPRSLRSLMSHFQHLFLRHFHQVHRVHLNHFLHLTRTRVHQSIFTRNSLHDCG
jgi:hypothetical protein